MMILRRAHLLNTRGQAMVEMAFVIGLLVLLIFGMTEFGRAMYTKNSLTNAARAGARKAVVTTGIVNCGDPNDPNRLGTIPLQSPCAGDEPIFTEISNNIVAAIDKPTVRVTVAIYAPNVDPNVDPSNTKPPPATTGDTVKVRVTADFNPVLKLMQTMISNKLTGEASMRYE